MIGSIGLRKVILVALVTLVCGGGAAQAASSAKPVLRIGIAIGPNPNPALGTGGSAAAFYDLAYAPLFHMKPNGTVEGGLATSWHYFTFGSGPNKGFEFVIRHDARFSDGTPVTAAAVAGWLNYFAGAPGSFSNLLGPKPTITAKGKWTVDIRLTVSNPIVPTVLSELRNWAYVASPTAVATPTLFATNSYGAGPYELDPSQSVTGDHYTFVPNPYYFDKASVKWSEVFLKVITDPTSMLQAAQTGQIDVASGSTPTLSAARSAGLSVLTWPASSVPLVLADANGSKVKALGDVRVRQAMNYAIDRPAISTAIYGNPNQGTSELLASGINDVKTRNYYSYNVSKAKSLLAAAGYSNGFTADAYYFPSVPDAGLPVEAAAKYLDAVGIHLNLVSTPGLRFFNGSFPIFQLGIAATPVPLEWPFFVPGGIFNPFNYNDPTITKLYYEGLKAKDPTKLWKEMYARVTSQALFLPITAAPAIYYVAKSVGGVSSSYNRAGFVFPTEWFSK